MTEANEQEANEQEQKRPLTLGRTGTRLELRRPVETGQVRQSFSHGRSKTVTVEVRKKRILVPGAPPESGRAEPAAPTTARAQPASPAPAVEPIRSPACVA
jgi:translation initiation factor IF-2